MRYILPNEVELIKDIILDGKIICDQCFVIKNDYLKCKIAYDNLSLSSQIQETYAVLVKIMGKRIYAKNSLF